MYKRCSFCHKENFREMTHCWNCEESLDGICVTLKKKIKVNPAIDKKRNIDSIKHSKE